MFIRYIYIYILTVCSTRLWPISNYFLFLLLTANKYDFRIRTRRTVALWAIKKKIWKKKKFITVCVLYINISDNSVRYMNRGHVSDKNFQWKFQKFCFQTTHVKSFSTPNKYSRKTRQLFRVYYKRMKTWTLIRKHETPRAVATGVYVLSIKKKKKRIKRIADRVEHD